MSLIELLATEQSTLKKMGLQHLRHAHQTKSVPVNQYQPDAGQRLPYPGQSGLFSWMQPGVMVGVALLATGCTPSLDTEAIARSIQTDLEGQGDIEFEKVICPDDLEPLVGQTFRCWGKLSEDEFFPIDVEQLLEVDETNGATAMDWRIPTSRGVLNLAELELEFQDALVAEISEEIGQDLEMPFQVDCGGVYRVNTPGETFTCQVENGVIVDARRLENVQVNLDSQGNINWQGVRNLIPPEELDAAIAEGIAFESIAPEESDDSEGGEAESPDDQQADDQQADDQQAVAGGDRPNS